MRRRTIPDSDIGRWSRSTSSEAQHPVNYSERSSPRSDSLLISVSHSRVCLESYTSSQSASHSHTGYFLVEEFQKRSNYTSQKRYASFDKIRQQAFKDKLSRDQLILDIVGIRKYVVFSIIIRTLL